MNVFITLASFPASTRVKCVAYARARATRNEGEETRKETEGKSENAGTVRRACCRNETVEKVAGWRGSEENGGGGSEARNGEL